MKRIMSLALALVIALGVVFSAGFTVSADPVLSVSDACIDILKEYEGFCQYPYYDYGQWTVGYGTRCPADKLDTYKANGITEEEADELLREFVASYEEDLNYFVGKYSLDTNQHEFDALFLFSYNVGSGWIYNTATNFHKTMIDPNADPDDVLYYFGMWSNAGNVPLTGLIKRRLAEANMYLNGVYSKNRPSNYCYVKYDACGGTVSGRVHAFNSESSAQVPVTPTYTGYTFDGWYTAMNGGTKVSVLDASLDGKTLYARWTSNESGSTGADDSYAEIDPPVKVTVTTDELYVRKGPGSNYASVGLVVRGDQLTVTSVSYDKQKRAWGSFEKGWVCLQYTNFESVMNGSQEEEETEPSQPETDNSGSTDTQEPTEEEKIMGTITANGGLIVRSGPGTGYERVGGYAQGARVQILEQKVVGSMIWGRTDKGWVSMKYVKLDSDDTQEPEGDSGSTDTEETPKEEEVTPPADEKVTGTVKVNGTLNIRSGAGTSYGIAGFYSNGAKVTILEQKTVGTTTWGRTDKGWISMTYVVLDTAGSGDQTGTGLTGTIKVESTLNIRNGAGTSYSIAGYYSNGAKVTILEQKMVGSTVWGRTDKGWISMAYVVLDSTDPDAGKVFVTVTASVLNVRETASTGSKVVGYLYSGAKVEILETKTVDGVEWGRIANGWIAMQYTK